VLGESTVKTAPVGAVPDLEVLDNIQRRLLWLATRIVDVANRREGLEIKVGGGENPVPVREVAPEGGDHLAWSAAGDAVVWSLGNTIHRQDAAAIGGGEDLAPDTFDAVVTEPRARPSGAILLKDAAQETLFTASRVMWGTSSSGMMP